MVLVLHLIGQSTLLADKKKMCVLLNFVFTLLRGALRDFDKKFFSPLGREKVYDDIGLTKDQMKPPVYCAYYSSLAD